MGVDIVQKFIVMCVCVDMRIFCTCLCVCEADVDFFLQNEKHVCAIKT